MWESFSRETGGNFCQRARGRRGVYCSSLFEWNDQEWEMTVKASSKAEAEALAKARAEVYLQEWAVNQIAANEKYGVYQF